MEAENYKKYKIPIIASYFVMFVIITIFIQRFPFLPKTIILLISLPVLSCSILYLIPSFFFYSFSAQFLENRQIGKPLFKLVIKLLSFIIVGSVLGVVMTMGWGWFYIPSVLTIFLTCTLITLIFSFILLKFSEDIKSFTKKLFVTQIILIVFVILFSIILSISLPTGSCKPSDIDCINSKAIETQNPIICEQSTNPDVCFLTMATSLHNELYCDNIKEEDIEDAYYKTRCKTEAYKGQLNPKMFEECAINKTRAVQECTDYCNSFNEDKKDVCYTELIYRFYNDFFNLCYKELGLMPHEDQPKVISCVTNKCQTLQYNPQLAAKCSDQARRL